ncbi:MAG: hypothetical protein WD623_17130 [Marinobacter sp.]|uniref:hypothetical protein n=1 Tax=Marinobacter sp. TaxID=50741 RepID=UPI00349FF8F1
MTSLGDRILGLGLLVLAVAYGWAAQQWPEPFGGAEGVGPETLPTIGGAPLRAFLTGLISAVMVFVLFNYGLSLSLPGGLLEVN